MPLQAVNKTIFPGLFSNKLYSQILSLIGNSKENGRHVKDICKLTGAGERTVRKAIETIRRNGVVIITDTVNGYWYPNTTEELRLYIRQEERRSGSTLHTLNTAKLLYYSVTAKEGECE